VRLRIRSRIRAAADRITDRGGRAVALRLELHVSFFRGIKPPVTERSYGHPQESLAVTDAVRPDFTRRIAFRVSERFTRLPTCRVYADL
jgi:hypothetical protein